MEKRIKFLLGGQKDFLLRVQAESKLHPDELAKLAGIVPRSYRDWKREKLCVTLKAAQKFSEKFCISLPEETEVMYKRWREYKRMVSQKGGIACFRKYGNPATPEGRRKGGSKTFSILRQKGIIPQLKKYRLPKNYTKHLAELVGISLGDGGITNGQFCVTLNSIKDKDYVAFVSALGENLFGEKPKIHKRKNCNAFALYYNGEFLVRYLVRIGLKVGNKVRQQVDVPEWVKKSKDFRIACLRGLMDTDGGLFWHKYKVNGKRYAYKKICFTNRSLPLLFFVRNVLRELSLTPKMITKVENKKVWLYNEQEVVRYMQIVGSHNERLLKQINVFNGGVR